VKRGLGAGQFGLHGCLKLAEAPGFHFVALSSQETRPSMLTPGNLPS
jgi:hypothetical protein